MIPLGSSDPLEERLRSLLRLPQEVPDPHPAVWKDGSIEFLSGEEAEAARRRWAEEDLRADIARWGARAMRPFGRSGWAPGAARQGKRRINKLRARRALRRTPYLIFMANNEPDDTPWSVEGYVLFEGGSLPMVLLAAEGMAEHVKKESSQREDYIFCEENDLLFEERWIVFPGRSVRKKEAKRALLAWYKELFQNDRRHPLQTGKTPEIRILF